MVKYYVEMAESVDESYPDFIPPELIRKYVSNVAEAESFYSNNINKFKNKNNVKADFVEMNHDPDPKKHKECKKFKIENGKVKDFVS